MKKQEAIVEVGESINQAVCEIMRLPGGSDVSVIYRAMMDSAQVELMDLGAFCEAEMIRASQAGAHFSSCLMGAAMNEAFLALMCLLFEHEVRETRQFHYSTRKLSDVDYRQVVANWSLEQFICIAEECNWIPANIVERGIVAALADGFRELMPMTNPGLSDGEIERGAMAFFAAPGSSMLRMTQSLRNAIHAGSWMR